jgi:uncharacterized protein (TIGR02996 family)
VTDLDALLAAVLDRPDDDTPRLVYADAIEEQAGAVACEMCHGGRWCPNCSGEGCSPYGVAANGDCLVDRCRHCANAREVPNGFAERAEFVRVQVELARMPDPECLHCWPGNGCRYHELRRREMVLWGVLNTTFDIGPPLPRSLRSEPRLESRLPSDHRAGSESDICIVSRGFIDAVTCDLRTWCGGECERCDGLGRITTGLAPDGIIISSSVTCSACHGTGRVIGIGPAVVRAHPVRRVVTDREPYESKYGWSWFEGPVSQHVIAYRIPSMVWDLLPHVDYPDLAAAIDALSTALLAWAKSAPVV